MGQHYYLVSTLPLLFYHTDQAMSRPEFLELCRPLLAKADFRVLSAAGLSSFATGSSGCVVLDKWLEWEKALRNELVKLRAKKKAVEPEGQLVDYAELLGVAELARQAAAEESPLAAEDRLNRARWDYLDQLEVLHFFDLAKLVIYSLRLQVLERKRLFDRERGKTRFQAQYAVTIQGIREEKA